MADIEVRQNGATVNASLSDRIVIRVPENGGTGYQWSIKEVGEALEIDSNEFLLPQQLRPGAAGERVVVLRPRRSGQAARVSLQLKREWEPEPIDHFSVDVKVAPS